MPNVKKTHKATETMVFSLEGDYRKLPCTIGIEGPDNKMMPLIRKGMRLPCEFKQVFTPIGSFQQAAYLHVTLGDRPFVKDDTTLCICQFNEGAFRAAGKARYELSVAVGGNRQITVRAINLDRARGAGRACIHYDSQVLSSEAIAQVCKSAEDGKETDEQYQERFNELDSARNKMSCLHDDLYPIAKRKMGLLDERRKYMAFRRKVLNLIAVGPTCISDAQMAELKSLIDVELPRWERLLCDKSAQVSAWYGK